MFETFRELIPDPDLYNWTVAGLSWLAGNVGLFAVWLAKRGASRTWCRWQARRERIRIERDAAADAEFALRLERITAPTPKPMTVPEPADTNHPPRVAKSHGYGAVTNAKAEAFSRARETAIKNGYDKMNCPDCGQFRLISRLAEAGRRHMKCDTCGWETLV